MNGLINLRTHLGVVCSFLLVFFPGSVVSQTDSMVLPDIDAMVQKTRQQYAPDRRVKQWVVEPLFRNGRWVMRGYTTEDGARAHLMQLLASAGIMAVDSIEVLPSVTLGQRHFGLANVSVTNNRYEPRQAAEMATQMTMGMPLQILKKQPGYLLVRTPDGYISWTEELMVHASTREDLTRWNHSRRIVFTDPFGHIRKDASDEAEVVSDIVAGGILQTTGIRRGFYAVTLPDGRSGFLRKGSAMPWEKWIESRKPQVEAVEGIARTMMGTPYLWGGTSVKGVDCSGFVKTSWYLQGVILPRDASQQAGIGEVVDVMQGDSLDLAKAMRNLQRGDLLFFSSLKDGKSTGRITHVAIYLADGQFLHASGLVRINSMKPGDPGYADWNTRAFSGARRIAGMNGAPGIVSVQKHPWYTE